MPFNTNMASIQDARYEAAPAIEPALQELRQGFIGHFHNISIFEFHLKYPVLRVVWFGHWP
jgi:hypothetical protein